VALLTSFIYIGAMPDAGTSPGLEPLLTVNEVAAALHASPATVRRLIREGELPVVRLRQVSGGLVRIRAADVRQLVEGEVIEDDSARPAGLASSTVGPPRTSA
jgi:excisionase family DNA binding protein